MGWRGTLRSLEAAGRRAQRESERRRKLALREQEIEDARLAVAAFNEYVDRLLSVHKRCLPSVDWEAVAKTKPPEKPSYSNAREQEAQWALNAYQPNVISKLFGWDAKKSKSLAAAVIEARQQDSESFAKAVEQHKCDLLNFEEEKRTAEAILAGDLSVFQEVIADRGPFSDIEELGTSLEFQLSESWCAEVSLRVHSDEIIPTEQPSQLKSGKLSVKSMPKGRFNELYQDHICSCVIRVARELFALLPIQFVFVHAVAEMLNAATGHIEWQPILSVAIPRKTLANLNMSAIDCSESMRNFVHNMCYRKTQGFSPCERLTPKEFHPSE